MQISAVMATFPGRQSVCLQSIKSLADQVHTLTLVLNEYKSVPDEYPTDSNVYYVLPDADLKDTGKFCVENSAEDFVFLCDDDILYPKNYVETLMHKYNLYEHINPVLGVHGVTYSDYFDGSADSRSVNVFFSSLKEDIFVNQLGTGTTICRGWQLPSFEFMRTSQRFVDLRFAIHCQQQNFPRICIARQGQWMQEIDAGPSIFSTYTIYWPENVVREAQKVAGFRYLPLGTPSTVLKNRINQIGFF